MAKTPPLSPSHQPADVAPDSPYFEAKDGLRRISLLEERRQFLRKAVSGTTLLALGGGLYALSDLLTGEAHAATRGDGRPRLPPGQRVLQALKPMGGEPGSPNLSEFRLLIHGLVEKPFELGFRDLLQAGAVDKLVDVHCVTGWSVLGARFRGVAIADLAKRAGLQPNARHAIFEAAHGYTSNVPLKEALAPDSMVTWELDGHRLPAAHGAPVRALIPDLYFWKSAKWLTGIRFVERDEPGFWETRGYHNHADPWREERYG